MIIKWLGELFFADFMGAFICDSRVWTPRNTRPHAVNG